MKKHIKPLIFLLFVAVVLVSIRKFNLSQYINQEALQAFLERTGGWAPLLFMTLYAVAPAFFLPGLPLTLVSGILFGPVWGVVYAIIGATIGATISFLLARYLIKDWISQKIKGTKLEHLYERVEREGWKLVAFTRLIPLFPFNLLNYAFGITTVKTSHYILTSFICMLPACIAYVVFGSSLIDLIQGRISKEFIIGILLIIALNILVLAIRKKRGQQP